MTRDDFARMLERLGTGWAAGDSAAVGAVFAEDVVYSDPTRYRFTRREDLLPFFEPPPDGQHVEWHRVVFDEAVQAGAVEYTYVGHHRYHGAVIVEIGDDGLIRSWREWQHIADERDWSSFIEGPAD